MDHQNIKFLDSAVPGFSLEAAAEIAREGYFGNLLKIRPPMVFTRDNADYPVAALGRAVEEAYPYLWWRGLTMRSIMTNRIPMATAAIQGSP